jgi:hypothetical protein
VVVFLPILAPPLQKVMAPFLPILFAPPFAKGGWGGFKPLPHHFINPGQHLIKLLQDLQVIKTQHQQSLACHTGITFMVSGKALRHLMLRAIQFDYQTCCRSMEICNVWADGFLAIELDTMYLLAPKPEPELLLGIGHVSAKLASVMFEYWVVWLHKIQSPSVPLLPAEGSLRSSGAPTGVPLAGARGKHVVVFCVLSSLPILQIGNMWRCTPLLQRGSMRHG